MATEKVSEGMAGQEKRRCIVDDITGHVMSPATLRISARL